MNLYGDNRYKQNTFRRVVEKEVKVQSMVETVFVFKTGIEVVLEIL